MNQGEILAVKFICAVIAIISVIAFSIKVAFKRARVTIKCMSWSRTCKIMESYTGYGLCSNGKFGFKQMERTLVSHTSEGDYSDTPTWPDIRKSRGSEYDVDYERYFIYGKDIDGKDFCYETSDMSEWNSFHVGEEIFINFSLWGNILSVER